MTRRAPSRRLLAALLVSLLAHLVAISGTWLRLPVNPPPPPPLEARLVSAPPPAPAPAPATVKPQPRSRPAARHTVPLHRTAPPVVADNTYALPQEPGPPTPAAPVSAGPAPAAATSAATEQPAPPRHLPRKGRITYTLYLGTDKFSVGETVQSWEIDGDTYRLASTSETTGIASLFAARHLTYLSKGKITARGLQPETFLMSRTRRGQLEAGEARFDWAAGSITFGKVSEPRRAALPAGSQDIVSFMYQLSLAPPAPGHLRLPITNGVGFETYELDVLNEETVETPLGALKALPVRQVRKPGDESIEIWLAADYRYLPVKIRFFDREGRPSGEQIVREIRISEE